MLEGLLFLFSLLRSRLKRGGCSPKVSLSRAGRGRRFLLPPRTAEVGDRARGPSPSRGAQRIPAATFQTPFRARPHPVNNRAPKGNAFGERGWGREETARRFRRARRAVGKRWPGRTGSPRAAPYLGAPRAGEASGGRRGPRTGPLAAGPSWAGAAAAAAESPGLWAAAAAGAAAAQQAPLRSGNRRPQARPLRGPGPGSGPDQHLGPDRNRPTCSSSSSSAGGRCRCARERTRRGGARGEAPRAGSRRRAHSALMEEEVGGSLLGSSALRAERTAAGAPSEPAAPERPPPAAALGFSILPQTLLPRLRRGGGEGGSQRPPAARRPRARPPRLSQFAAGWEPRPSRPPRERRPDRPTALLAAGSGREHLVPRGLAEGREGRLPQAGPTYAVVLRREVRD